MSDTQGERCGRSFETICNFPKGHKGICGFEPVAAQPAEEVMAETSGNVQDFLMRCLGCVVRPDAEEVAIYSWGHDFIVALTRRLSEEGKAGWQLAHDRAACGHPRACWQSEGWAEKETPIICIMCEALKKKAENFTAAQPAAMERLLARCKNALVCVANPKYADSEAEPVGVPVYFPVWIHDNEVLEARACVKAAEAALAALQPSEPQPVVVTNNSLASLQRYSPSEHTRGWMEKKDDGEWLLRNEVLLVSASKEPKP